MGLLNFLFGKKKTEEVIKELKEEVKKVDKSNKISLKKERIEKVKYTLKKKNINKLTSEVKFIIDCSGSMETLYRTGEVAEIIERVFPIALVLDDNKAMEVKLFNEYCKDYQTVTESNLENYKNILGNPAQGGTNYAPAIQKIIKEAKAGEYKFPALIIFITDGDNWDKAETKKALKEASEYPIFFKFIGIGNGNFNFLRELDDLTDRKFDNADFQKINNIKAIKDEELYSSLINEYVDIYQKLIK